MEGEEYLIIIKGKKGNISFAAVINKSKYLCDSLFFFLLCCWKGTKVTSSSSSPCSCYCVYSLLFFNFYLFCDLLPAPPVPHSSSSVSYIFLLRSYNYVYGNLHLLMMFLYALVALKKLIYLVLR